MKKVMLIDATHKEETRVAVMGDGRLEEFDYESTYRKPLRGNIYLAKVTRVEPSLQAAFVNYGGNRHGFLPFSEIHPDYFRIPVSDREALLAEQEEALRQHDEEHAEDDDAEADDDASEEASEDDGAEIIDDEKDVEEVGGEADLEGDAEESSDEAGNTKTDGDEHLHEDGDVNGNVKSEASDDDAEDEQNSGNRRGGRGRGRNQGGRGRGGRGRGRGRGRNSAHRSRRVENFGEGPEAEESRFRFNLRRKYKIQEVVKRGQIMLIQVSKEERGNKGAAVTSYLSLPGRYCVLMPNSPRAGGVSRKISNYKDRAQNA